MHNIRNTGDLESIRADRRLIISRQNLLEKVEEQVSNWVLFFIISSAVIMLSIIMGIVMEYTGNLWIARVIIITIISICIAWWFWTLAFILDITKNQKIIYQLLNEISQDIEIVKSEIIEVDASSSK